MHEAGCMIIFFGFESGSQRILELLKKGITPEQSVRAGRICKENKLLIFANYMLGMPTETLEDLDKTYEAMIRLGSTTPSFDLETEVDQTYPWEHISREMVDEVLSGFTGGLEQLPPQYSAKSVGGKRAYEMARKGKKLELKPQKIAIHRLEILSFDPPELSIKVECTKGTYIRSLAP